MKKNIIYIISIILIATACKEEKLNTYSGDNYVYLTYMQDRAQQQITFNFATDAPLSKEGIVKVRMSLWGNMLKKNATCNFSVIEKLSTAHLGKDFEPLKSGTFRAAFIEDTFEVIVHRNKELLSTYFTLTLSLDTVSDCLVRPLEYKNVTIKVIDEISKPKWWNQSAAARLGEYSNMKYRVFVIYMNGEIITSLDKYTGIEFNEKIGDFKKWWQNQWLQGNYMYYDKDRKTPLYETILDK